MWTYDDYNEHKRLFALRLKYACKHKGMTCMDLVRATGISSGTVSCYLRGRNSPSISNAVLLAQALGVSLDWLGGLTDEWPF